MNKQKKSVFLQALFSILIITLLSTGPMIASGQEGGYTIYLPSMANGAPPVIPLRVASMPFAGKFSPFFIETDPDADVVGLTQLGLLTTDRKGGVVYNAATGETRDYMGVDYLYEGPANVAVTYNPDTDTTTYRAELRDDLMFSDGTSVTADDIIFTYYTLLDPSYEGRNSLNYYPIIGLREYQTQVTDEVYQIYYQLFEDIYAAGRYYNPNLNDPWTEAQAQSVWSLLDEGGMAEVVKIVDYVFSNYLGAYAEAYTGFTPEEISANPGLQVMFGMVIWDFGEVDLEGDHSLTTSSGVNFDLVTQFPSYQDFYEEILLAYEDNIQAAFPYESADGTDVFWSVRFAFISYWGPLDPSMGDGIPNIQGVVKVDDFTVEITTAGYEAPAIYSILGIPVTPLHYYGNVNKYDYANNQFGFDFGDLSKQISLINQPLGAGPYQFDRHEGNTVYFSRNENYYKGVPKIREIQFIETIQAEIPAAIKNDLIEIYAMSYNSTRYEEIASYNSNGEMSGDVITTSFVHNMGYGYIGLNAATVNIGGDSSSAASKNLRKGISTIISVYREAAIENYYGDGAEVVEYPISKTSWASPEPTDPDYQKAFSVDVTGNPIYTTGMTTEEKISAAEQAALGFFQAAGYTISNGIIVAPPSGGAMSFEVIVPGEGTGDHPSMGIVTGAHNSLAEIGFDLVVNDITDANYLWDALDSGTQQLWTAAWGSSIDPDMYQVYYSTNVVGGGGTESNHYYIQDPVLDQLILEARMSTDQNYRQLLYRQALDIIIDWGVEIPTYQRLNAVLFSTQRVNIETLTPAITTFWGWTNDIELLELNN